MQQAVCQLEAPWIILACFTAFLGACVGSFLNVCIYRIPREKSIVRPRSFCPHCEHLIPWYLNIPLLSWILLRGRCKFCKAPISPRYWVVELLTACLFLAALFQYFIYPDTLGMQAVADWRLVPVHMIFISGLILGSFVDLEHQIIPDSVTIGGIVLGLLLSGFIPSMHGAQAWHQGLFRALTGAALGFSVTWLIGYLGAKAFKQEAMGFGDVKLMGAIGAFLGWQGVLFALFAGSLFGSFAGVALILTRKAAMRAHIPFGPYLALAALCWLFWGQQLCHAYFGLLRL